MHETKAKLLIVDDEPSIRMSLSYVLAEIGYRVRTAEDGVSALTAIRDEAPEIILFFRDLAIGKQNLRSERRGSGCAAQAKGLG